MWRRLARVALIVTSVAWGVTVAVWVRGRFRADLIGVVLPGHVYVEFQSHADGNVVDDADCFQVQVTRRWPAPPSIHRSSAPAAFHQTEVESPADELVGPGESASWLWIQRDQWQWRDFVLTRSRWQFQTGSDGRPLMDLPRRGWNFGLDSVRSTDRLPTVSVLLPAWTPPIGCSIPLAIALAIGWRRRRVRTSRRRRGLCVRCGYDRRHSPGRCPECGVAAVA